MSIANTPTLSYTNAPAELSRDRQFGKRNFIIVAVVLLLAAVGLNAAVSFLQLHFKKEPVPMRASFKDAMPLVIGDWVQVARDENLPPDLKAALGTDEYLFCSYVKASAFGRKPEELRKEFEGKDLKQQQGLLHKMRSDAAHAKTASAAHGILSVSLTYYTGKADTVAHIPERCYIGDGFETAGSANEQWTLADGRRAQGVRRLTFENATGAQLHKSHVAYFFHVNGRYEHDSLAVRAQLQDLFAKHGYYAKVELRMDTPLAEDPRAWEAMRDFLSVGLAPVEAALPDWSQYAAAAKGK